MQTQIPSGAHNDEEAFQPPEMNLANEADENNDEAEADVEPRYGYWSSNKNKCLAALILAATIICVLAAGGSIKTAYDSKRSNAVGLDAYIEECEPGVKRSLLRLRHEERKLKQQPSPSSSCSICGDGMRVGNPDAETDAFSFNGQAGMISCGVLQIMGTVRLIPPPQCEVLPQLISTICECDSTNPTTTTVATPTVFTTTEATTPGKSGKSMPSHSLSVSSEAAKSERMLQQQPSCSICGDGMRVGNPDAAVSFPGQAGQIPCGVLQNMGTVGLIPPSQCAVLPQLVSTICECESTTPPTTTVPPTTTTEATKPASGKSGKSMSVSMSVSSKAAKAKSEIIKCNTTKSSKVNRK